MIGIRQENRRKLIEGNFPIRLGVVDLRRRSGIHELRMVMRLVMNSNGRLAKQNILFDERESTSNPETELVESGAKVTRLVEFGIEVRLLETFTVITELLLRGLR